MKIELKYGDSHLDLNLDEKNLLGILKLKEAPGLADVNLALRQALDNPIRTKKLSQIAKGKKTACIVVADYTRGVPYKRESYNLLVPIVDELKAGGIKKQNIKFLVGTGAHRAHTLKENLDNFGEEVVNNFEMISHDCKSNNVSLGKLSTGNELWVDKLWVESDVKVLTGMITTHYFGGFSGGRKGILPGVAGYETIRANHAMITNPEVDIAKTKGNPISDEMDEAAKKAKVDFILNVVINDKKQIVKVLAGDLEKAFELGVETCKEIYKVEVNKLADIVFACAGGYPKDVSLYQSQKAINNAKLVLKEGGTIVLIAECREGIGSDAFSEWLYKAKDLDELLNTDSKKITVGGHTAVGNAKVLKRFKILVVSKIEKEVLEKRFYHYAPNLEQALNLIREWHGENYTAYVMPQAGLIYPYYKR
jgi:nickel-dependent lactate racemase